MRPRRVTIRAMHPFAPKPTLAALLVCSVSSVAWTQSESPPESALVAPPVTISAPPMNAPPSPPTSWSPVSIALHHDVHAAPGDDPIDRFGVTGEPLAYMDWLCVTFDRDAGRDVELDLDEISARDELGRPLGRFVAGSGRFHRFTKFPLRGTHRYCARIRNDHRRVDAVQFAPDASAPWRYSRVVFAWRGDTSGCARNGTREHCGELRPALASFAYAGAAIQYAHLDVGRWQTSTVDVNRGLVDPIARYRVTGFLPLWLTAIGSPAGFQSVLETGLDLPITFASEGAFGNGTVPRSYVGFGLGLYLAQCVAVRAAVTPRICAGLDAELVVDAVIQSGIVTATEPRFIGGWFVSIGAGAH